jgi:cell division protein ZapA
MSLKGERIEVKIFGQQYTLRGEAEAGYANELAQYVDQKMQEISAQSRSGSPQQVAILAAINIAHELFQCRKNQKEQERAIGEKTKDIIESIEEQFEEFRLEFPHSA